MNERFSPFSYWLKRCEEWYFNENEQKLSLFPRHRCHAQSRYWITFPKAMWDWFAWLRLNEKILMYHIIWIVSFRQSWFLRLWLQREKFSYASHDMRLEVRRYAYCSNALVSLVKNRPHIKALAYASNFGSFRIPNMSLAQFRFSDIKVSENKIAFG